MANLLLATVNFEPWVVLPFICSLLGEISYLRDVSYGDRGRPMSAFFELPIRYFGFSFTFRTLSMYHLALLRRTNPLYVFDKV